MNQSRSMSGMCFAAESRPQPELRDAVFQGRLRCREVEVTARTRVSRELGCSFLMRSAGNEGARVDRS